MIRSFLIAGCAAVAVAFAGVAQAQVAAPLLSPGSINLLPTQLGFEADPSFVPMNPATMPWSGKSSIGLGQASAKREQSEPSKNTFELSGTYGGLMWNADKFALGLETADMSSDTTGQDFSYKLTQAGLAGMVSDWVSVGGSLGKVDTDGGNSTDAVNTWSVGGSIKLGTMFYVGVGTGKESIKHEETGNNWDDDRTVTQYGLALYTGGKGGAGGGGSSSGTMWHLEYNIVEKDDFTDGQGDSVQGYTRSTGTIEVLWNNILLSYSAIGVKAKTGDGELDGSAIEAGWVSDKGLYITGRVISFSETIDPLKNDISGTAINVGFQF